MLKINEQKFNNLLKNTTLTHEIMEFNPKLAEYILTNLNANNRNPKVKKIQEYRDSMINGSWDLNGESIKFGWDGLLKDGQNRLRACLQSKMPFTSCVHFGLNPKFFLTLDTGANRHAVDVFKIMGVPNHDKVPGVLRAIYGWENNLHPKSIGLNNRELQAIYENDTDIKLLEESIKYTRRLKHLYSLNYLSALYYLASQKGHNNKVKNFMDELSVVMTLRPRSPIKKAMTFISDRKQERITQSSHQYSVIITRVWDCYLNKRQLLLNELTVKNDDRITPIK
jgi:hypothetical protein